MTKRGYWVVDLTQIWPGNVPRQKIYLVWVFPSQSRAGGCTQNPMIKVLSLFNGSFHCSAVFIIGIQAYPFYKPIGILMPRTPDLSQTWATVVSTNSPPIYDSFTYRYGPPGKNHSQMLNDFGILVGQHTKYSTVIIIVPPSFCDIISNYNHCHCPPRAVETMRIPENYLKAKGWGRMPEESRPAAHTQGCPIESRMVRKTNIADLVVQMKVRSFPAPLLRTERDRREVPKIS